MQRKVNRSDSDYHYGKEKHKRNVYKMMLECKQREVMPRDINDYSRVERWDCLQRTMCSCRMPRKRRIQPTKLSRLNASELSCKTDKRVYQAISSIRDYQI
jgi:SET domain-containing protein